MAELMLLLLDCIEIAKRERVFRVELMQELKINISDIGLIHPITVAATDQPDKFRLVAGHHRLEAFRALCQEGQHTYASIPAMVIAAHEALKVELCENLYRSDLNVLEKAEHLTGYLATTTDTVSEAIEALSRSAKASSRTFYRYKAIGEGIHIAAELKQLNSALLNSTNQLYYLAKKCPHRTTQARILETLKLRPELTVQDAHALVMQAAGAVTEKLVPLQVPLSFREQVAKLSKQHQMNKKEFTEKFLSSALKAFEQGDFPLS